MTPDGRRAFDGEWTKKLVSGGRTTARRGRADCPVDGLQASSFFSRSETIWGGTAEVQRNIVGERILGLPKESKPQNED